MASAGMMVAADRFEAFDFSTVRIVVIKTAWNLHITGALSAGCAAVLEKNRVAYEECTVPGAVELTFAAQNYIKRHPGTHAAIVLGCVIRGETPHFDYVCQSVTQGITYLNATLDVPVIFGVLTVNNEQEAIERIGGVHGHKGEEAALTALDMIVFKTGNLFLKK